MANFITATARAVGVPTLLTILALALPTPAGAQGTVTPTQGHTAAPTTAPSTAAHPRRAGNGGIESRIADLHKRLKITAEQEGEWKQVADIMRQNAASVEAAIKERSQNATTMNAIDNLRSYEKIIQAHEESLQRLMPAFQSLYDHMPDAQKKTADQVFRAAIARAARRQG